MTGLTMPRRKIEGLDASMLATDAAHVAIAQRFAAVAVALPLAALKADADDKHVHQLRVASRRADAALRVFKSCFTRKAYRKARQALKRIRRAAGAARTCDVQFHLLRQLDLNGDGADAARNRRRAAEFLTNFVQANRSEAQREVNRIAGRYHSKKLGKLQHALLKSMRSAKRMQANDECTMTFAELARKRLGKLANNVRDVAMTIAAGEPTIADLHALRIRGKRLRYAMEIFSACFDDGLRKPYKRIEAMQEALGEINDADELARLCSDVMHGAEDHPSMAQKLSPPVQAAIASLRRERLARRDALVAEFLRDLRAGAWDIALGENKRRGGEVQS